MDKAAPSFDRKRTYFGQRKLLSPRGSYAIEDVNW